MSDTLVFIPAWNEEENLPAVLDDLKAELPDVDVLVVDDGSTDGTADVAREHGAEVLSLGDEPRACRSGSPPATAGRSSTGYAYCGRVDADGQHPPAELARLLALVRRTIAATSPSARASSRATATRRTATSRPARGASAPRSSGARWGSVLGRPFGDATSGLYAVNAKALPLLAEPFTTEAPEVEALIRIVDAGLRLEEVPVNMAERAGGESKLRGQQGGQGRADGRRHARSRRSSSGAGERGEEEPKRIVLGAVGIALVVATFFFLLPTIADYEDVWDVVRISRGSGSSRSSSPRRSTS